MQFDSLPCPRGDHGTDSSGYGQTYLVEALDLSNIPIPNRFTLIKRVKNGSGGTLAKCVAVCASTQGLIVGAVTTTNAAMGIVDSAIGSATVANGEYFWLAVGGAHYTLSESSYSALDKLKTAGTGGKVDTSTGGITDVGIAIEAATDASQYKLTELSGFAPV